MKRIFTFFVALVLCAGLIPLRPAIAETDMDALIRAFENTQDENYRVSGDVRIFTPFENTALMNLRIFMTIMKAGESFSQSFRFNLNVTEGDNAFNTHGNVRILSNSEGESYMRLGNFHADTNDKDVAEKISEITNILNNTIANTYLRTDPFNDLATLSGSIDKELYEIANILQEESIEPTDIIKKFFHIMNGRVVEITRMGNKYTIRPAKSISQKDAEAFAHDFYYFLKDDLSIPDITESDYEQMMEDAYEGLNEILTELNNQASMYIQIITANNKISNVRYVVRSKDSDFPLMISGSFKYINRTPRRISMPRCFIDMVDLFDILQTIDADSNDHSYLQRRLEDMKSQESCR